MIVFDTSVLAIAFDENAAVPPDPDTGVVILKCRERTDHLLGTLNQAKQRVLIPTPVLAEYLVQGGPDKDKRLQEFVGSRVFEIGAFDQRAAVECALLEDGATKNGRKLNEAETKAKVKFDRQIIAISKTRGASRLYTGDKNLACRAIENGLKVTMTWEIPLPPRGTDQLGLFESKDEQIRNGTTKKKF
jgi:hypothetical protein